MNLTGKLYVNNVMLRSQIEMGTMRLDPGATLQIINDARRRVYNEISSLKPWAFMKLKVAVAPPYTFATSDRCMGIVNVWNPNVTPPGPGIEMSIPEQAKILSNDLVTGTVNFPKWTATGTPITVTVYPKDLTQIATVTIGYKQSPADLAYADAEDAIPWEFQELVVMYALAAVQMKKANLGSVDLIGDDVKKYTEAYKRTFFQSLAWQRINTPARQPQA